MNDNRQGRPPGAVLSWQEYMILTEQSPVLIWRADTTKACDYFNEYWLEFTGRSMEQEVGNGWAEGVHPDDFDRCLEIYVSAFDRQEPFEMEYRLRRNDGEYRWIFDRGAPFYDETGEFAGYIGSCIDVHETVLARKARKEKRERELDTLRGLLPICMQCKKIRDDEGYWNRIEEYIVKHAPVDFTHGICPECIAELYSDEEDSKG
ncbi:MAG: PAS domain-containing protein [Thermoleophilia bacterium]